MRVYIPRPLLVAAALVSGLVYSSNTQAAIALSTYAFTGQTNGAIPVGGAAVTSSAGNVTASTITRNNLLVSVDTNASLWPSAPFLSTSTDTTLTGAPYTTATGAGASDAVTNGSYFTFTVTANAGYELDLTSLTFTATKGGGSTRGFAIQTSATGFSTNGSTNINTGAPSPNTNTNQTILGTGAVSANYATTLSTSRTTAYSNFDITLGAPYQNLTSITFRVYSFAASNFQSVEFDNIVINGDAVETSAVPEPSMLALGLMTAVPMLIGRRRGVRNA